jgi:hypothetical protein
MADRAENLSTAGFNDVAGLFFEIVTERIVAGDEEPLFTALLDDGFGDAVCQGPGVIGPMDGIRRALGAGEQRSAGPGADQHLVFLPHDLVDGERHRGVWHIQD